MIDCDGSKPDFVAVLRSQLLCSSGTISHAEQVPQKSSFWSYFWFQFMRDIHAVERLPFAERERCLTEVWNAEVLLDWDSMRDSSRTRELYYMGVPVTMRGRFWRLAIGNRLQIQPSMYVELAALAGERRAQSDGNNIYFEKNQLLAKTAQALHVDVPRTFPHLEFFHENETLKLSENVSKLLEAFVMLRPDVGYSQGMSFLGAMLLLYMEPCDAFVAFTNVLNESRLSSFFQNEFDKVNIYMQAFSQLLAKHLPSLKRHFDRLGIEPPMFLLGWVMSIYTRVFPLDLASRVWDLFVMEGDSVLFGVALAVLEVLDSRLLS